MRSLSLNLIFRAISSFKVLSLTTILILHAYKLLTQLRHTYCIQKLLNGIKED